MKRMLFNATQAEELRVAIVDGQKLIDLDIESASKEQRKSNIYKGTITRIEPSLEACFVDYGAERHGFLPFKEISRQAIGIHDGRVSDQLREGMELIVQVDKDERGNKGAALTSYVSLAGRYLVLMPNNPRGGGVSRRIEGEDRNELRDQLSKLDLPSGMSTIARTAGIGRSEEELQWDLNYLLQLWTAIEDAARSQKAPFLIYQESSLVIRAIRDYYKPEIGEILVDTEEVYEQAQQFMQHVMPDNLQRVKLYRDNVPLFSRFQIEHQIETAYGRTVQLPSGGSIVIDHTEALVAVDVNSARATRGTDIENTALATNLEAVDEVARQLRLRDLGGLIVIDFIDMESPKNQRAIEERLHEALRYDRARVQISKISRFGLLELSRQRLRPALTESTHMPCPRCHGIGHIRGTESTALHILRILQEEAMKENTAQIIAQVPVDVATFLLNEKRNDVFMIEARFKVNILLVPNRHWETPNFSIERLRSDEISTDLQQTPSFERVEQPQEPAVIRDKKEELKEVRQEAKVKGIKHEILPPEEKKGFFARLFDFFKAGEPEVEKPAEKSARRTDNRKQESGDKKQQRGERAERQDKRREKTERPERAERPEKQPRKKQEVSETSDKKPQRAERQDRAERTERPERAERPERQERSNRRRNEEGGERVERAERPERAERAPRAEPRSERRRERDDDAAPRGRRAVAAPVETEEQTPALNKDEDFNATTLTFVVDDTVPPVVAEEAPASDAAEPRERRQGRGGRGIHGRRGVRNRREDRRTEDNALPVPEALEETSVQLTIIPEFSTSLMTIPDLPTLSEVPFPPSDEGRRERKNGERKSSNRKSERRSDAVAEAIAATIDPPDTFASSSTASLTRSRAPRQESEARPAPAPAPGISLAPNLADAGLQMVETRHTAAVVEETVEPPRPKRVRPPRQMIQDEPLQLVETAKKD